jgi:hypothetical protein
VALRRWPPAGDPIDLQTVLTVFVGIVALRRWPAAGDPVNPQTILTVFVTGGCAPLAGGR